MSSYQKALLSEWTMQPYPFCRFWPPYIVMSTLPSIFEMPMALQVRQGLWLQFKSCWLAKITPSLCLQNLSQFFTFLDFFSSRLYKFVHFSTGFAGNHYWNRIRIFTTFSQQLLLLQKPVIILGFLWCLQIAIHDHKHLKYLLVKISRKATSWQCWEILKTSNAKHW